VNKPVAIVLGGTNPHKELIENLKKRGYFTILVDYNENPPAKETADYYFQESTLDKEKVLSIARLQKANLVISTCVDQANVTACYVGEKLGLPIPCSYQCALDISNKVTMKERMKAANISTSKFISVIENASYSLNGLNFPLVVKPSDSNGSKGVRRVNNQSELNQYLNEAFIVSRNKQVIIEEFVDGVEVGIDCFVTENNAHIISMHRKRKPVSKNGDVIFSIGSISPPGISDAATIKIETIANQIAEVFNLKNTPLLIQVIVAGDEVNVIEFAPRIGGGLNFRKINLFAQFDIIDAAVDSFLGVKVIPNFVNPNFLYSENHIYTDPGVFGEIIGYQELIKNNTVVGFYPNKTRGMIINSGKASKDRSASFIVKANSTEEIVEKVKATLNTVKVLDVNGCELNFLKYYNNLLF
jgi:biotin carboxylase